jgi:hypothetical protein
MGINNLFHGEVFPLCVFWMFDSGQFIGERNQRNPFTNVLVTLSSPSACPYSILPFPKWIMSTIAIDYLLAKSLHGCVNEVRSSCRLGPLCRILGLIDLSRVEWKFFVNGSPSNEGFHGKVKDYANRTRVT